jgi:very-short-patch-repair endonuclease
VPTSVPHHALEVDARRQHGLFTLAQALRAGFTRGAVARRLASGEWEQVARHVMRSCPAAPLTWHQRLLAQVIATRGVASHSSAAALHGLVPEAVDLEVTVLRSARSTSNRRAHSTWDLPPVDVATVDGIPCTAPARTLIDLGAGMPLPEFDDILDTALVRRLVSPRTLTDRAIELWAPRRSGCAVVLARLDDRSPQLAHARNAWEARVLREIRARRLPDPVCNLPVVVGGRRRVIDFAWPAHMVAVEFDGFAPHSSRRVFDDDRVRQNDLVDRGWRVYRLTATALTSRPRAALTPIARALGVNW